MSARRPIGVEAALLLCLGLAAGCVSGPRAAGREGAVTLPVWFTAPSADEQPDAPVNIGMELPAHLKAYEEKYALPSWVVYGVVRCLGAGEFVVNGALRRYTVRDESGGESSIVLDKLHYDVPAGRTDAILRDIGARCMVAGTERERQDVLGRYVRRRFGGILLFSLNSAAAAAGEPEGAGRNLLLESGQSTDAIETFTVAALPEHPPLGWQETDAAFQVTLAGEFRYGDPVRSFRAVEEEAIHEMARGVVMKFSHMRKQYAAVREASGAEGVQEEAYKEELTLRMRGVRVVRRAVDMARGVCMVVVRVPRSGVAVR